MVLCLNGKAKPLVNRPIHTYILTHIELLFAKKAFKPMKRMCFYGIECLVMYYDLNQRERFFVKPVLQFSPIYSSDS